MSSGHFDELLYPQPDEDNREERLEKLRRQLDDPETRDALADYLSNREYQAQLAQEDPDRYWEAATVGKAADIETDNELAALSMALASNLGARRRRWAILPTTVWLPAIVGAAIGVLAFWLGGTLITQLETRPQPTFAAAFSVLLDQAQPSAEERELIDDLLEWHEHAIPQAPNTASRKLVGQVSDLLEHYQPTSDEIREVRKLIGVYHPPDDEMKPPPK